MKKKKGRKKNESGRRERERKEKEGNCPRSEEFFSEEHFSFLPL
jgi:hypothetical protein